MRRVSNLLESGVGEDNLWLANESLLEELKCEMRWG